ncbi:1-acylglycerol-3-phosphate O-acyltransferase [Coemansia sp. RSA 1199]|nr:1-acylglycerol-3-phosphate O-acyltransferase [Coemansia sp. RSA 1199]
MGMASLYSLFATLLFYFQLLLFVFCVLVASAAGLAASPLLALVRRRPAANWIAAQVLRVLAEQVLGVAVDVDGTEHLAHARVQPCIIVANHQSLLDVVWLACVLPHRTVVVANMFIAHLPVLGWFMRLAGNLFVRQGDKLSIKALFDGALRSLEHDRVSVVLFPEGRRNGGSESLLEFKKGAFYLAYCTHVPIIPIAVQSTRALYSWSDRRFCRNAVIRMRVLPPIATQSLAEEDIPALISSTRNDIQKACIALSSPAHAHQQ